MTIKEAENLIIKHYDEYFNKKVYFADTGDILVIKAIDITEDDNGNYDATCYTQNSTEEDADFENGIFAHRSLNEVIKNGTLVPYN